MNISHIVGENCIFEADAKLPRELMMLHLKMGGPVTVSFRGVYLLTTHFLDALIGPVVAICGDKFDKFFSFITPDGQYERMIKETIQNAKKHIENPNWMDESVADIAQ